jgi:ABC-type nitrate/sulfonate/bicarbonate transport system substrate-binding protein
VPSSVPIAESRSPRALPKGARTGASRTLPSVWTAGFVGLVDAAPLLMARELGLFSKHGLRVELRRAIGWASARDGVVGGSLEVSHAPAGLVVAASMGLGTPKVDCVGFMELNRHGNAITLSKTLYSKIARDPRKLPGVLSELGRKAVFGMAHSHSSHRAILSRWLLDAGVPSLDDVRMVVLPPTQMALNMASGNLDGFCVGEPWNSLAVARGTGHIAAVSAEVMPGHTEKVVMARRSLLKSEPARLRDLERVLSEACAYCEEPSNLPHVARVVSRAIGSEASETVVARSLIGPLDFGGSVRRVGTFYHFTGTPCGPEARRIGLEVERQFKLTRTGSEVPGFGRDQFVRCFSPEQSEVTSKP